MSKQKKFLGIFFVVFVLLACAVIRIGAAVYIPPILMYHSITESPQSKDSLSVSRNTFERQMRFLAERHYNVVALETLASFIRTKTKIPSRTIAVTFDDGRRDNYTYAFPVLKAYRIPATIFVIVNEIGRPDRLHWDEIGTLLYSGLVTIGSHTLDHPYLPEVGQDEELWSQVADSKKILEDKLHRSVLTFSYPVGGFNRKVRQAVIDAGYTLAVATSPGKSIPDNDVFALKRVKITERDGNLFSFWAKASGYYVGIKQYLSRKKSIGYGD